MAVVGADGADHGAVRERDQELRERNRIDLVSFRRGERKDERTQQYLRSWPGGEGVLYIGRAQEKARVLRTERRHDPRTGASYPWLVDSTAFVNHYYVYAVDDDFGPFFLKFCSYFPYNAKLCINGHEYLKRQLTKRGIAFEALDNGILRCADPRRMQRLADGLTAKRVDALLRKWLARLPHPFAAGDRQQGIRYDVSMLQAEFARTEVLDRPAQGRVFFEEVVRENLDMGRPDHVQLIFNRRVHRRTPSRYRTRVITDGVTPSLHVDYKHSRIKQYHKEGRALRVGAKIDSVFSLSGFDGVVPFRHDAVRSDAQLSHLGVGDLDAGLVGLAHEVGAHTQSGGGAGGAQVVQDGLVAVEGAARPVLADFAEQAVFDGVPLRRGGRVMGHGDAQAVAVAEAMLQVELPGARRGTVAAAAVGEDLQGLGLRIVLAALGAPPLLDAVDGERRGVGGSADEDGAGIGARVVDAVGDGEALGIGGKVVVVDEFGAAVHFAPGLRKAPTSSFFCLVSRICG